MWVRCENGFKVIVNRTVIFFNEDEMTCKELSDVKVSEIAPIRETILENQIGNAVNPNDLIEVEPTKSEKIRNKINLKMKMKLLISL